MHKPSNIPPVENRPCNLMVFDFLIDTNASYLPWFSDVPRLFLSFCPHVLWFLYCFSQVKVHFEVVCRKTVAP